MIYALSTPVNLIGEIDEESSARCVRRVLARVLGHAGLNLAEAQYVWIQAGHSPDLWRDYIPTIESV